MPKYLPSHQLKRKTKEISERQTSMFSRVFPELYILPYLQIKMFSCTFKVGAYGGKEDKENKNSLMILS